MRATFFAVSSSSGEMSLNRRSLIVRTNGATSAIAVSPCGDNETRTLRRSEELGLLIRSPRRTSRPTSVVTWVGASAMCSERSLTVTPSRLCW